MVSLKKVYPSMFEDIYPLLREFDLSELPKSSWKNLFNNNWDRQEDYCGYALFNDEKVVGFLGLIFSQRIINNKLEKFCNLTTWFVQKEFRDYSLSLMMPVVRLKGYTITDLSPSYAVCQISKKLGFQELDSRIVLILPFKLFANSYLSNNYQITHDKTLIYKHLSEQDQKILTDHKNYPCHHLLFYSEQDYCYLIYTTHQYKAIRYTNIPFAHIQYISNRELFARSSQTICNSILQENSSKLVVVDQRLVKNLKIPFSIVLPFYLPRLHKSSSLMPEDIDTLYSEIILLNLGVMPSPDEIWQAIICLIKEKLRFDNK